MARAKMDENIQVEHSSGNVFADLGLPNPEEHLVKATIEPFNVLLNRGLKHVLGIVVLKHAKVEI